MEVVASGHPPVVPCVEVQDEVYGWLLGRVVDPFGQHREIGRPLGPWPPAGGDGKERP